MRVERIDPTTAAEAASTLLTKAWQPPAVHYPPEYLEWQISFPGPLQPIAVGVFDGAELIGFAAAMNRRVRIGDDFRDVYLCSFVAVHPDRRGPVSIVLLRAFVRECRQQKVPVVGFAAPGGQGEQMVAACFKAAGYCHGLLGLCRPYASVVRATDHGTIAVSRGDSSEEIAEALSGSVSPATMCNAPTALQCDHYRRDPRGGDLFIARAASEASILGVGLVTHSQVRTAQGVQKLPAIDCIASPVPIDVEALRCLAAATAARWSCPGHPQMIVAPNLSTVDASVIKGAGFREMAGAAQYRGYVFTLDPLDGLLVARLTNLEVV